MKRTETIIIGGGQAGLAMSRCLSDRGVDNVILERGRIAERWRSERWDSLRLLSPRWQLRLPGYQYEGSERDGFMKMPELVRYFERYAHSFSAPVESETSVLSVKRDDDEGYRVTTDRGVWSAPNVVVATGQCDTPFVPLLAAGLGASVDQLVPTKYRNPGELSGGGVLVVGASATGVQLAEELRLSGRKVVLAASRHTRLPRQYRGRDILSWIDEMGMFDDAAADIGDLDGVRRGPSFQLVGRPDHRSLDLGALREMGVILAGRLDGTSGTRVAFGDDLANDMRSADTKQDKLLDRIDAYACITGQGGAHAERPAHLAPEAGPAELDLRAEGIDTILWCTGFTQRYPWLQVPVLSERGAIVHDGGVTASPGLYALGLHWMRRRGSMTIDGVGKDAEDLAAHIDARSTRRPSLAA